MAHAQDFETALNYAFLLLRYRLRSVAELLSRLKKKGYPEAVSNKVIGYLQDNNYLNDQNFVSEFIRSAESKGWGLRKIEIALKKAGIKKGIYNDFFSDYTRQNAVLKKLIEKRKNFYENKKNGEQKFIRFLVQRGFNLKDILTELKKT